MTRPRFIRKFDSVDFALREREGDDVGPPDEDAVAAGRDEQREVAVALVGRDQLLGVVGDVGGHGAALDRVVRGLVHAARAEVQGHGDGRLLERKVALTVPGNFTVWQCVTVFSVFFR